MKVSGLCTLSAGSKIFHIHTSIVVFYHFPNEQMCKCGFEICYGQSLSKAHNLLNTFTMPEISVCSKPKNDLTYHATNKCRDEAHMQGRNISSSKGCRLDNTFMEDKRRTIPVQKEEFQYLQCPGIERMFLRIRGLSRSKGPGPSRSFQKKTTKSFLILAGAPQLESGADERAWSREGWSLVYKRILEFATQNDDPVLHLIIIVSNFPFYWFVYNWKTLSRIMDRDVDKLTPCFLIQWYMTLWYIDKC